MTSMIEIICLTCGASKSIRLSYATKPNHGKYCSRDCAREARRNTHFQKCKTHGYMKLGRKLEHREIVERVLGRPLPSRHPVHHHNEDRSDNSHSNLVVCESRAYHVLIHALTRILKAGGDPRLDKLCSGPCKQLKPLTAFPLSKNGLSGRGFTCGDCKRAYDIANPKSKRKVA